MEEFVQFSRDVKQIHQKRRAKIVDSVESQISSLKPTKLQSKSSNYKMEPTYNSIKLNVHNGKPLKCSSDSTCLESSQRSLGQHKLTMSKSLIFDTIKINQK